MKNRKVTINVRKALEEKIVDTRYWMLDPRS